MGNDIRARGTQFGIDISRQRRADALGGGWARLGRRGELVLPWSGVRARRADFLHVKRQRSAGVVVKRRLSGTYQEGDIKREFPAHGAGVGVARSRWCSREVAAMHVEVRAGGGGRVAAAAG